MKTASCFGPAHILLPGENIPLEKWGCVACDQFTSDRAYWERADAAVGSCPSTLRLILPEANLKAPNVDEFIADINASMSKYLEEGIFETLKDSLIYIERGQSDGKIRHGLIGMVDLDQYDFTPGSGALIRATEGTVLDRIPPRARVRRNAPIELPHVMLLIDDPEKTVIEPLTAAADKMESVYDFDLMENGGHIKGYKLSAAQIDAVADALTGLTTDEAMKSKYGVSGVAPLLFAVGDGNHSLATAKAYWEELKPTLSEEQRKTHPARWCLAEVCNVHSPAIEIEPIHRVVFGVDAKELYAALDAWDQQQGSSTTMSDQRLRLADAHGESAVALANPPAPLTVGSVEAFLADFLPAHPGVTVDYIHGESTALALASDPAKPATAILLPDFAKADLFKGVVLGGVLPRKTFSMGHAEEKRYYNECRVIGV